MKTIDCVEEFHVKMGLGHSRRPGMGAVDTKEKETLENVSGMLRRLSRALYDLAEFHGSMSLLRLALMQEELSEVAEAMYHHDVSELLHELSDIQYVLDGTFLSFGLDKMKMAAVEEIHRANMTKEPITDGSGKIVKGENYVPPNVKGLF